MARLSLSQSPKFKVLVRTLGIPTPHVRGYLELFWESAHFRDDAYFKSFDEIEAAADWQGERGQFAQTLLDQNWIESNGQGYLIHDYEEHLPSYVRSRRRQKDYRKSVRGQLQDNAEELRDSNVTVVRQSHQEKRNEMKGNEKEEKESLACKEARVAPDYSEPFEKFWKEYPKRVGKKESWIEWKKKGLDSQIDMILDALRKQKANKAELIKANQFTPEFKDPERWIKKERWNDELEKPQDRPVNLSIPIQPKPSSDRDDVWSRIDPKTGCTP